MSSSNLSLIGVVLSPFKLLSKLLGSVAQSIVGWVASRIHSTIIGRLVSLDVLRYAICGFTNYIIVDALLYYLIYHYVIGDDNYINLVVMTISPHVASLIIVFPLTFLSGFWLNRHVAFASTQERAGTQMLRYALSIVGSIVLSYVILKFLVEGVGIWATPSKIIASLITAIYSYLVARLYTFKVKKEAGEGI